jgi:DNA-binding NtrC family response regulator
MAAWGHRRDPIRVLLVDDEVEFCDALAKVLRRRRLVVEVAASGEQALSRLGAEACEVVVLDLKMPGLDGVETLRQIRARWPAIAVILLTGHGTVEAGIEALGEQAFDFLLKPVVAEKLVEVIEAAAQARREQSEAGGERRAEREK